MFSRILVPLDGSRLAEEPLPRSPKWRGCTAPRSSSSARPSHAAFPERDPTEIALNLAFALRRRGAEVTLVDLDLVKPYLRCRMARDDLEAEGIRLVAPGGDRFYADLAGPRGARRRSMVV